MIKRRTAKIVTEPKSKKPGYGVKIVKSRGKINKKVKY